MSELLAAALRYAAQGWPVLPLHNPVNRECSCGCRDCPSPAKHPRTPHGLKDASRDPQTLRDWWQRWPRANLGLVTGTVADVADLDGPDGLATFRTRCEENDLDPRTLPRVGTGRGVHVYFAPTGTGNRARVFPGLDWRGREGYVVAPPSRHIDGTVYAWRQTLDGTPPLTPLWLAKLLEQPKADPVVAAAFGAGSSRPYGQRALEVEVTRVLQAAPGERNDTLNRAAFSLHQLVAGGELDDNVVDSALTRAGMAIGLAPLEVDRTIASGRRNGAREPRSGSIVSRRPAPVAQLPHAFSNPLPATELGDELRDGDAAVGHLGAAYSSNSPWPSPMADAAYHGLAGEVVRAVDPHTEADPVAVLMSLLVAFGNVVNAAPHVVVGSTHHPARLDVALVGETARARKGDSWAAVRRLMAAAAPQWAQDQIQGGLSSGEGLIAAVRDRSEQTDRKTGEVSTVDPGVSDKRLLVVEPELARVLKVMHRDGSTLSTILRDAWDTGTLRVMTKVQLRATGAHLSVLGHITVEELRRELDDTSLANGFANRFLWIAVRRSKLVPDPEPFGGAVVQALAQRIRLALDFSKSVTELERDDETRRVWREVYPALTADRPGMLGAVLNRCEAQAVRLSLTYAILDRSPVIRRTHLEAALAVLDYVEESARFIFANRLGDAVADTITRAIDQRGELTRTEISDLFNRHVSAARIGAALDSLVSAGLMVRDERPTAGRPVEIWRRPK